MIREKGTRRDEGKSCFCTIFFILSKSTLNHYLDSLIDLRFANNKHFYTVFKQYMSINKNKYEW